jgi:hypothetical protein
VGPPAGGAMDLRPLGAPLIGSDIQDGILPKIADLTNHGSWLADRCRHSRDRRSAHWRKAGIQVPTPWAPADAGATTKSWPGRGPYI